MLQATIYCIVYSNDIKTAFAIVLVNFQILFSRLYDTFFLLSAQKFFRMPKTRSFPRFHFNKNYCLAVACNNVYLALLVAPVSLKYFIALLVEELGGLILCLFAYLKRVGQLLFYPPK